MKIKRLYAKAVLDSRKEKTIQVVIRTEKGKYKTSAPAGESTGKYEVKPYAKNLSEDIDYINNINVKKINKILDKKKINTPDKAFTLLKDTEKIIYNKIGANTLFVFEASFLKAIAAENNKELWKFLIGKKKPEFPRSVGNAIGGGMHSIGRNGRKPDFQEFLFIANGKSFSECSKLNYKAYKLVGKSLNYLVSRKNDEGAFETHLSNGEVLDVMKNIQEKILRKYKKKIDIGIDIAASSFYSNGNYIYKNSERKLNREEQISYILYLIEKYNIKYIEDPFDETDFLGFSELRKKAENKFRNCMIVGDDLTTTNPKRLKKAIKLKSINAIIVKPNQIGSLLKVKEVIEICKRNKIKTIISHRSGETMDNTIADLCVGLQCDFIKTGIFGNVRKAKLKRLMKIERS